MDYIINSSFQGVNTLFVPSFENNVHQISHKRNFLLTVETKDYNVMIDGRTVLDQAVKNGKRTYKNIQKVKNGQRDDSAVAFLLDIFVSKNIRVGKRFR